MKKIIVVGGGAAGMMAAYMASGEKTKVVLLEKNEKLGKKIYITGKGRCNVTNASEMEVLFQQTVSNSKFLYSAFYSFTNEDMMNLLEQLGCRLKTERGNRVFPVSDHASDVISGLERGLKQKNVQVKLRTKVTELVVSDGICQGVMIGEERLEADAVIVTTGGFSYQTTGSTGDGYRFAREQGMEVTTLRPALVPLVTKEGFEGDLMGLSLRNISVTIGNGKKVYYSDFGEMLFTHFGVSGPVILSGSSVIGKALEKEKKLILTIDLKPALSEEQLDARILRDFEEDMNKQFKNVIGKLFPTKLIPVMIERCGISPEKKVHEITREERKQLVNVTKHFTMTITGTRDFNEAIITQGGISVKEINPSTMETKKVAGLYFAGEVLDLDALTGGYNLQIAWSTGYVAGISAAEQ